MKETVQVKAPSNIALMKYWGKDNPVLQWPANDSLSMTLNHAHTICRVGPLDGGSDHAIKINDEVVTRASNERVFKHVDMIIKELGEEGYLQVDSRNSFPTACGLASSASGFAALTVGVFGCLKGVTYTRDMLASYSGVQKLAALARLGSGSAFRSLQGGFVWWQRGASALEQKVRQVLEPEKWLIHDFVVLFSDKPKSVSSTDAHKLAWSSPLFKPRLAGHRVRLQQTLEALKERDFRRLGMLMETEALEMHAVAMSSRPPVFYFDQEVSEFLAWLREERQRRDLPVYFTMDAGPNVHVLCESKNVHHVEALLQERFPSKQIFHDAVGRGPVIETAFLSPEL